MLDITYYESHLARHADGKKPKPGLSPWITVASTFGAMGMNAFKPRRAWRARPSNGWLALALIFDGAHQPQRMVRQEIHQILWKIVTHTFNPVKASVRNQAMQTASRVRTYQRGPRCHER